MKRHTTTAKQPGRCRFTELPAELRLEIYEYLLPEEITIGLSIGRFKVPKTSTAALTTYTSLMKINRQIHDEVSEALYASTKFTLQPAANTVIAFFNAPGYIIEAAALFRNMTKVEFDLGEYGNNLADTVRVVLWCLKNCKDVKELKIAVDASRISSELADTLLGAFKFIECPGRTVLELTDGIRLGYRGEGFGELCKVLEMTKSSPHVVDTVNRKKIVSWEK